MSVAIANSRLELHEFILLNLVVVVGMIILWFTFPPAAFVGLLILAIVIRAWINGSNEYKKNEEKRKALKALC